MPRKVVKNNNFVVNTIAIRTVEENGQSIPKTFYLVKGADDSLSASTFVMKKGDTKIAFKLSFQELFKLYKILEDAVAELIEDMKEFHGVE